MALDVLRGRELGSGVGELVYFFFQAEDGIRDLVRSRGLGDVYKRQVRTVIYSNTRTTGNCFRLPNLPEIRVVRSGPSYRCLLYTSDAADDLLCVDLGRRRIIKKKNNKKNTKLIIFPNATTHPHHHTSPTSIVSLVDT